MSLTALALRTAAVEALKGRTWAGALVFDTAGDVPIGTAPAFAIVAETAGLEGRRVTTSLTVQLWAWCETVDVENNPTLAWGIPATSPATERLLDAIVTQVALELAADWGWANVFRGLCASEVTLTVVPQAGIAMRMISFDHDAIAAPKNWSEATGVWAEFKAELDLSTGEGTKADTRLHAVKALFATVGAGSAPDWAALGFPIFEPVASEAAASPDAAPTAKRGRSRKASRK